jgi:hypothetical protein
LNEREWPLPRSGGILEFVGHRGAARACSARERRNNFPNSNNRGRDRSPDASWEDEGWWRARIDTAVSGGDTVISNLRITLAHQDLSLALRHITGAASGANFHTWAVWGSKKAGRTIREEELPMLKRAGWALGSMAGASVGVSRSDASVAGRAAASIAVGSAAGAALQLAARVATARARREIFRGNVTVLTDIGRETARFVSAFLRPENRTAQHLEKFLAGLRPGHVTSGGQDLLAGAYRHYYLAADGEDPDRRDECMLYANLLAILHEHHRLDPYIEAAVPRPLRRTVTRHLLGFTVGTEPLRVSRDVPRVGSRRFPETLNRIETPELADFLFGPAGWDRTPDTLTGSAAHDWTKLEDRMNFIVDLFRSRQAEPVLFTPPYSDEQRAMILAGRVPSGKL